MVNTLININLLESVKDYSDRKGIPLQTVYKQVKRNDLKTVKVGKITLIIIKSDVDTIPEITKHKGVDRSQAYSVLMNGVKYFLLRALDDNIPGKSVMIKGEKHFFVEAETPPDKGKDNE